MNAGDRLALLTTSGLVAVVVCPLCASLALAEGLEQHTLAHAAALRDQDVDQDGGER